MSFNKQLTRLQQLDRLIRMRCTGNACELSGKLQISESSLFLLLQTARELGAKIRFNHYRFTYEYIKPMRFVCGFESLDRKELHNTRGGKRMTKFAFRPN
jgi:hypothetical protein